MNVTIPPTVQGTVAIAPMAFKGTHIFLMVAQVIKNLSVKIYKIRKRKKREQKWRESRERAEAYIRLHFFYVDVY